jgi:DnaK suppressor protein
MLSLGPRRLERLSDDLSEDQRKQLRSLLEREREALLRRAGLPIAEGAGLGEAEPSDLQEKAAEEASRRALLSLDARARARLADIDAALRRFERGTYGICEETGEPIPWARLRAEPTTRFTVEALELLEDEDDRHHRSSSTEPDDGTAY